MKVSLSSRLFLFYLEWQDGLKITESDLSVSCLLVFKSKLYYPPIVGVNSCLCVKGFTKSI